MIPPRRRARALFLTALCLGLAPATPAPAQSAADRDVQAVNAYTLTMPRFKQFLAAGANLATAADNPAVGQAFENTGALSLDQLARRYDAVPEVRAAIAAAGLTTRDFLLLQAALLQAGLTYGLIKDGTITRESAIKSAKISAANLDFYQQNEAEIARLAAEAEENGSAPPASDGSDDDEDEGSDSP